MSTRLGFRPRPVDITRELLIVRDENELDREESAKDLPVLETAKSENQGTTKAAAVSAKTKPEHPPKPSIIPIPPVTRVPSYQTDYLPVHTVSVTYQKAPRDKREIWENEWLEYDLDVQDCRFLRDVNQHGMQGRLTAAQLEAMLWTLEVQNADATERALQVSGTNASERTNATVLASTDHLPKVAALQAVALAAQCQSYIHDRVYEYWREKRKLTQRPMLRRLQAPTPESDNNPYLVFRQRAKPNKPQTRRRRETQEESLEKIKAILENVQLALKMCDSLRAREMTKAQVLNNFVDRSQYQLLAVMRLRPPAELERALQQAWKTSGKARMFDPGALLRPGQRVPSTRPRDVPGPPVQDAGIKKARKAKPKRGSKADMVIALPLPPPQPDPCLPFAEIDCNRDWDAVMPDAEANAAVKAGLKQQRLRLRIGRCGRVLVDQLDVPPDATGVERGDADGSASAGGCKEQADAVHKRLEKLLLLV